MENITLNPVAISVFKGNWSERAQVPLNNSVTTAAFNVTMIFGNFNNGAHAYNTTFITNESTISYPTGVSDGFSHIPKYGTPVMVILCILLAVLILATIMGNVFVIAAVLLDRSLQGVSNYLILSLAVTDLLVAVCVMPLSLVYEVSVFWYLGNTICDFWIYVDVLCCTASILHLVAISIDRFWGVSSINYIRRRCAKQIFKMIAVVWLVAVGISIPRLFGWKDEQNNPEKYGICMIRQNLAFTVFSTVGAFYCPLVLMVFLNFKIYIVARTRIRKKNCRGRNNPFPTNVLCAGMKTLNRTSSCSEDDGYTMFNGSMVIATALNEEMQMSECDAQTPPVNNESYLTVPNIRHLFTRGTNGHMDHTDVSCATQAKDVPNSVDINTTHQSTAKHSENNNHKHDLLKPKKKLRAADRKRKDKMEMKRERKAVKVLGVITGAFIACWLPFFVLAVLAPFCAEHCDIPDSLFSFCVWLGYFNSSLNPILYTIFNPSFRKAFHKILYGKCRIRE